jgi:6-phosphogluconolactonase/glucosamine-6-phosphate isomerase/deaminase
MQFLREEDSVAATEAWLQSRVEKYGARSLFLPAGETPRALYQHWRENPPAFLKGLRLLQVDDVADGPGQGMFAKFFAEELPGYTVHFPEGAERADLAILGFGTNGHVAFHEPHLPTGFSFGTVELEEDTTKRLSLPKGTKGITYGVGAFREASAILLLVKGAGKQAAWSRFQNGDESLPVSALRHHADISVWKSL